MRSNAIDKPRLEAPFRPHRAHVQHYRLKTDDHQAAFRIVAVAIDRNLTIFTETQRRVGRRSSPRAAYRRRLQADGRVRSRVLFADRRYPQSSLCFVEVPFAARFGFVAESSLRQLNATRLPTLGKDNFRL